MHCNIKKVCDLVFESFIKMASQKCFTSIFNIFKDNHAYRSGVKVGDRLFCTIDPDNKHSDNAIVVKSGNDHIVGHVPETLAKKLFNLMKSQQIEIMDSEVTADPRPTPEGKLAIGTGIGIPYKYRLYGPKSVKKEARAGLK